MSSIVSSGEGLSIADNENEASADSNPYAYPYFHSDHSSPLVYDLVVKFGRRWNEVGGDPDASFAELQHLVKKIQFRCYAQPLETHWTDSCGDSPLHRLAQVARFPSSMSDSHLSLTSLFVDIAEALIEAYPGSATTACNNWRETPLHQFVSHCGFPNNNDSTQVYVAHQSIKNPMLDLIQLLSRDGACTMRNWWGSLPLHDACELVGWEVQLTFDGEHQESSLLTWIKAEHAKMVNWLISQNPQAINETDHAHQTPLYRAFSSLKCNMDVIETLLSQSDNLTTATPALWKHYSLSVMCKMDASDPDSAVKRLGILWDTTMAVLLKRNPNQSRLVHTAVSLQTCPFSVVDLLMCMHHEQLLEKDENGCTPLILAILNHRDEAEVFDVLDKQPDAASIPDNQGRLPLLLAAVHECSVDNVLEPLFDAHPAALVTRDPVTLLYPFAVAATTSKARREAQQLSIILCLLRADPSLLTNKSKVAQ